jgi:nicotinamide mononucleotide (NMN) deamidase PncC
MRLRPQEMLDPQKMITPKSTVFIALATPNEVIVEKYNFGQPRDKVIDSAVIKSLELLKRNFKIVP